MTGNNWRLHWFWPVCLKYVTAPAVGLVFTFAYPKFLSRAEDQFLFEQPPFLYSFILMHIVIVFILGFFVAPSFANFLIPAVRRGDGKFDVMPQVTIGETPVIGGTSGLEAGVPAESPMVEQNPEVVYGEK